LRPQKREGEASRTEMPFLMDCSHFDDSVRLGNVKAEFSAHSLPRFETGRPWDTSFKGFPRLTTRLSYSF